MASSGNDQRKKPHGNLYPEGLQANATRIDPDVPFTPLYTTYRLTDYHYKNEAEFGICDLDTEHLRAVSIMNKK